MMPGKDKIDKNSISSASPPPSLQSTRRKSRGEQINFRLSPVEPSTSATFQKRKKHWRSPSNPIDLNMNCELVHHAALAKQRNNPIEHTYHNNKMAQNALLTHKNTIPAPTIHSITSLPGSPCQNTQKGQQLNFAGKRHQNDITAGLSNLSVNNSALTVNTKEMTIIKSEKVHVTKPPSERLYPYETLLLRGPQFHSPKFQMIAELSISPIVSTGSSDYTSTRRHVFTFESSYCRADLSAKESSSFDATSLAHGLIDPLRSADVGNKRKNVTFSRCSLLQVILRNPQDNSVAGIFVVKLELSDMPAESRTILRQKAYKSKCLTDDSDISTDTAPDYLAKFIEIPLKRSYDPQANRQKIHLAGPIRVAFSFNRSNLRYTTPRRSDASAVEPVQKTRTILQFPCEHQKYFPLRTESTITNNHDRLRSSSLTTESATRSFQHGSLCL